MDKIRKFLRRLNKTEKIKVLKLLHDISNNSLSKLTVKKLQGLKDLYRIRIGKIRIIFKKTDKKNVIINIDYRKDSYKDL